MNTFCAMDSPIVYSIYAMASQSIPAIAAAALYADHDDEGGDDDGLYRWC